MLRVSCRVSEWEANGIRTSAARHPVAVYLAGLGSRASRRATIGALKRIAGVVPTFSIAAPIVEAWDPAAAMQLRSLLAAKFAPATANASLAALRGVLRAATMLEQFPRDRFAAVCDALDPVRGSRPRPGREITADELAQLFEACGPTKGTPDELARAGYAPVRNRAILALLYGCGLRRAELAALDVEDVDPRLQRVRVRGKGNKVRWVPIGRAIWPHVDAWHSLRRNAGAGLSWALVQGRRNDPWSPERISESGIYAVVRALSTGLGLAPITPHDFRRTLVGDLIDKGADLPTIAGIVGHGSITTTQKYDRRPERAQRAAVDLLELPTAPGGAGSGTRAGA